MLKELLKRTMPAEVLSALRSAKLQYATLTFSPKVVRHDYGGQSLLVHINDAFAESAYDHDWPEVPELTLLSKYGLKSGATVFNVGAHQGVVALLLAGYVGETGSVVAVEASPYHCKICSLNGASNNVGNLEVLNAAIAAEPGTLKFADSLCGHVDDGHGGIEVKARTIDDLADEFGHPDVLFIDIEGFECEALRGAEKTLSLGCDAFVEVHGGVGLEKYGGSIEQVLSHFPPEQYDLFYSENDQSGAFSPVVDREGLAEPLRGKRWFLVATRKAEAQ